MKSNRFFAISLFLFSLPLAGCTTEPSSIFKFFDLHENVSVSTGSRQRVITNSRVGSNSIPGQVNPDRIVCAEPSPDVATALANSFGVGVSVLGQGSGSLAASSAEGVIQLAERTVTVQLLRDQMYRACEAFANGAISGTTYSLVMSGINDTMVTLLLGETAGGAFGRKLGSIDSSSQSEARAALKGLRDTNKKTQEAAADLAKADKAVEEQQKIYDKKKGLAQGKDANTKEATEAKTEKQKLDDLKRQRDALAELLSAAATTMASAAAKVEATAGGTISNKPGAKTAAVLAGMQVAFLETDNSKSFVAACLVEMGRSLAFVSGLVPTDAEELKALQDLDDDLRSLGKELLFQRKLSNEAQFGVQDAERTSESDFFSKLLAHWGDLRDLASYEDATLDDQTRADRALDIVIAFDRRRKPTALTSYCDRYLAIFVRDLGLERSSNKTKLELARIDASRLQYGADFLAQYNNLVEKCGKANQAEKARCDLVYMKLGL
ncbi:MAG: hypothetical protein V3R17_06265 [Hyphomicrobium sp.]